MGTQKLNFSCDGFPERRPGNFRIAIDQRAREFALPRQRFATVLPACCLRISRLLESFDSLRSGAASEDVSAQVFVVRDFCQTFVYVGSVD